MAPPHERRDNDGVLTYLGQGADPASVTVERPTPETDTWRLGAHPDIVERLWKDLNGALPVDCRYLVGGGAALVDPHSRQILAVALGTQYALHLTADDFVAARELGFQATHEFRTVGRSLDLGATFGPGWVFGCHDEREAGWLAETYRAANL